MSEQTFDPFELQESIYLVAETASDPGQAARQLRELADRLTAGGQPLAAGGPHGAAVVVPEATPRPSLEPVPIGQLDQAIHDMERQAASLDGRDRQEFLHDAVGAINAGLDRHAREASPHLYPPAPAENDQQLGELGARINRAWVEGDTDAALELAGLLNQSLDRARGDFLARQDDLERRQVQAARQRRAQGRQQQPAGR